VDETTITDGRDDTHLVSRLTSLTAPSEKVATAVSWLVSPIAVNDDLPVTLNRVSCAGDGGAGVGVGVVALLLHAVQTDVITMTQAQKPRFITTL
jgi:hypothetical protein